MNLIKGEGNEGGEEEGREVTFVSTCIPFKVPIIQGI